MALPRIKKLEFRFKLSTEFFQQYEGVIQVYIHSGVLNKVPINEL